MIDKRPSFRKMVSMGSSVFPPPKRGKGIIYHSSLLLIELALEMKKEERKKDNWLFYEQLVLACTFVTPRACARGNVIGFVSSSVV